MTYLIALIIAIALGAVIALLSFTNIGSGFSGQSAKANAQQFANAVSQLEISTAAFQASGGAVNQLTDLTIANQILRGDHGSSNGAWLRTDIPNTISSVPGSAITLSLVDDVPVLSISLDNENVCNEIDDIASLTCSGSGSSFTGTVGNSEVGSED